MTLFASHNRAWGRQVDNSFTTSSSSRSSRCPTRQAIDPGFGTAKENPTATATSTKRSTAIVVGEGEENKDITKQYFRCDQAVVGVGVGVDFDNADDFVTINAAATADNNNDIIENKNVRKDDSDQDDDARASATEEEPSPSSTFTKTMPKQHSMMTKMTTKTTTRNIPSEISCHASVKSSQSELEIEVELELGLEPQHTTTLKKRQRDLLLLHNKHMICLVGLLESDRFDDNCIGMERLMAMANQELVNCGSQLLLGGSDDDDNNDNDNRAPSLLLSSSIAYSLVFEMSRNHQQHQQHNNNKSGEFSKRLRAVFPSFLCEQHRPQLQQQQQQQKPDNNSTTTKTTRKNVAVDSNNHTGDSSESSSSKENVCCSTTTSSSSGRTSRQDKVCRTSLKLPALRILVSSLELVSRTTPSRPSSSSPSLHLIDDFWRLMLAYMTECLQDLVVVTAAETGSTTTACRDDSTTTTTNNNNNNICNSSSSSSSIETALVVKGFRLLHRLQPEMMGPYVRYSLLPFVSNAKEFGQSESSSGDKMLVRECERLLKSL